jgi:hypothetical protein
MAGSVGISSGWESHSTAIRIARASQTQMATEMNKMGTDERDGQSIMSSHPIHLFASVFISVTPFAVSSTFGSGFADNPE